VKGTINLNASASPHAGDVATAVLRLLADPAGRVRLGRAARQLHARVFALDHTLAVLLAADVPASAVA